MCSNRLVVMGILMVDVQIERLLILARRSKSFHLVSYEKLIEMQDSFGICIVLALRCISPFKFVDNTSKLNTENIFIHFIVLEDMQMPV